MAAATGHSASRQATDRQAALRRVAIVLSSLPAATAARLLGAIDPQAKQTLRRTMSNLADVDPLERRRAIEAFKVSVAQPAAELGSAEPLSAYENPRQSGEGGFGPTLGHSLATDSIIKEADVPQAEPESPLSFLGEVSDDQLARLLSKEHPQAVALVMASVAPAKAGHVLPLLPETIRAETLRRVGRLEEIPQTAAEDMAAHFRQQLEAIKGQAAHQRGQQKLDAILANMASGIAQPRVSAQIPPSAPEPAGVSPSPTVMSDAETSALELGQRLRLVPRDPEDVLGDSPENESPQIAESEQAVDSRLPTADAVAAAPYAEPISTDQVNQHLINLSPADLCSVLGKGDTEDAVLALCGLPFEVAEAAINLLPPDAAKMIRHEMANLSLLNLRQIDEAKERVARRSLEGSENSTVPLAA